MNSLSIKDSICVIYLLFNALFRFVATTWGHQTVSSYLGQRAKFLTRATSPTQYLPKALSDFLDSNAMDSSDARTDSLNYELTYLVLGVE